MKICLVYIELIDSIYYIIINHIGLITSVLVFLFYQWLSSKLTSLHLLRMDSFSIHQFKEMTPTSKFIGLFLNLECYPV